MALWNKVTIGNGRCILTAFLGVFLYKITRNTSIVKVFISCLFDIYAFIINSISIIRAEWISFGTLYM